MHIREVVAALHVLGALVTVGGVVTAYLQAVRQKRRFEKVADLNGSDDEPDFVDTFEKAKAGETVELAAQAAAWSAQEAELQGALLAAGVKDSLPTWNDMRLPVAYWSRRTALADTIATFKTGGVAALAGLGLTTTASVWSLYL